LQSLTDFPVGGTEAVPVAAERPDPDRHRDIWRTTPSCFAAVAGPILARDLSPFLPDLAGKSGAGVPIPPTGSTAASGSADAEIHRKFGKNPPINAIPGPIARLSVHRIDKEGFLT
jgi:hypothetical protein